METIIFGIIALVLLAVIIFLVLRKNAGGGEGLHLLQSQIENLARTLDTRMHDTNKLAQESLQSQFGEFSKMSREVADKLARLEETNKQVMSFTDQLQSLQDILKNPKQRGILGEYFLETLLKNVLPPGSYEMQYPFKDGVIVDAVVKVRDKVIPIDSKFSLENYNRIVGERDPVERERLEKVFRNDLKTRIDETAKYVRPTEGTMDFAFMFIPHEAIYYDLLINQIGAVKVNTRDLIEYAFKDKRVIIVSPTSFLAYLQTVLQGLKALQIEEGAKEIREGVERLGKHLLAFEDYLGKLGGSLETANNRFRDATAEFGKIDKDITKISKIPDFDKLEE